MFARVRPHLGVGFIIVVESGRRIAPHRCSPRQAKWRGGGCLPPTEDRAFGGARGEYLESVAIHRKSSEPWRHGRYNSLKWPRRGANNGARARDTGASPMTSILSASLKWPKADAASFSPKLACSVNNNTRIEKYLSRAPLRAAEVSASNEMTEAAISCAAAVVKATKLAMSQVANALQNSSALKCPSQLALTRPNKSAVNGKYPVVLYMRCRDSSSK